MISGAVGPGDHEHETSSIWLVSILGGEPRRLRGDAYNARLSPDDEFVVYESDYDIWLADSNGDNPRSFIENEDWGYLGSPAWSHDGRRIVYHKRSRDGRKNVETIESRAVDGDESIVLVQDDQLTVTFLALRDRLVYVKNETEGDDENLWEIALDPRSGKPRGEPRRLTDWVGFDIGGLSVTADGSKVAFYNERGQDDVYVGELAPGGRAFAGEPRRLTLDDRDDSPKTWTPDSRAVVFQSNRSGDRDLYVQALDQRNAEDLVLGDDRQGGVQRTPDGKSYLYWERPEDAEGPGAKSRLMRIPVNGGPAETVLEIEGGGLVACASTPDGDCFMLRFHFEEMAAAVHLLDPVEGLGEELWRYDVEPRRVWQADLSPDGSRLAVIGHTEDQRSIRVLDVRTQETLRDIEVVGVPGMELDSPAWSATGDGWYFTGSTPRGLVLVHVDPEGEATVLYEALTGWLFDVKPSPDGRWLAFGKQTPDTNVWMLDGL